MSAELGSFGSGDEFFDGAHEVPAHSNDRKHVDLFLVVAPSFLKHFFLPGVFAMFTTASWQRVPNQITTVR